MLFVVSNHKIIIIWPSPLILIIFLFKIITTLELIDKKNLGPTENQVPDPPENFRVESLTPNSATLRWDPPSSIDNILVRGYTLSYGTGSTDTRKVVLEGAENVEYTLNMLKPNTSYVLSLTAYNEAYGEDSSRLLLLIKTPLNNFQQAKDEVLEEENNKYLLNNLLLPKPSGLKVEKTGNVDEFLLYWDEPKELINENNKKKNFIYYIVQYWKDSGILKDGRIKEELHKINVEHPPALLTGIKLINSNKYLAKVKLISSNGSMSQWSEKLPLLRKSEEKINKNRWKSGGGKIIGEEVEEDFCGFELPSICDFFREGQWRWERRNSTKDGFSMVIREQLKTLKEFNLKNKKELYGRLLSPMFNLKPSETFCVSVQTKLERGGFGAIFRVGIRFESEPQPLWLYRKSLQRFWPQGEWLRLSWQLRRKLVNRGFQLIFDVSKHNEADQIKFFFSLDNLFVRASDCPIELEPFFGAAPDEETEANLLIPVENLIDTDPRVFRTAGLDGLPAVGIKRGVEIVVPYRIYLPRKFYRNFAILASIRPSDNLGGFLFAVLNAFDTIVELGVQLQSAGPTQTNISLFYTDSSSTDSSEQRSTSRVLASFLVPVFAGQWTQFALEVHEQTVGLYFRCMRYAVRQVYRHPTQLQMDDASKLYIANAGPIIGGGFEGAIQELKLHDDPAEAANQCNENWWKKRRRDFSREGDYQPQDSEKSGLVSSGFGSLEENGLRVDDGEEEGRFPSTPPGSGPARFLPKNINLLTTTTLTTTTKQQKEETKTTLPPTLQTPPLIQQQIQMIPGPKGERGEPGISGTCAVTECRMPPPGPPGLQGPPGVFPGLTEHDLRRIAAWPGVKGEKGDRGECCDKTISKQTYREGYQDGGEEEVVLLNGQHNDQLPAYNRKVHGSSNSIKGEKGDRGEQGPTGLPGKLIEKPQSSSFSGVRVFQTALELLAATPNCPIGFLAFALSTQQLFIRVNSGWKQIILGGNLLTAQSGTKERTVDDNVSSPSISNNNADDSDELNRLSYWLALDEPSSDEFRADNEMINTLPSPEQRWQPRFPPKENRRFEEEKEEEKQKNRVPSVQQKRHKDRIIHLIALNEPLNGNFGGVRGADLECYKQARQFGFTTTFRAFLSSRVQDLNKVVHEDDRNYTPIVNIRGERLFDSWNSVFDGERSVHAHVPIYSFNRRDVISDNIWPDRWLWHGSTAEGSRTSTAFCDGWYSDNSNSFGNASPLHSRHSLTGQSKEANCNNRFVVLCVEVMSKFNVDSKLGKRFMSDDVIRK